MIVVRGVKRIFIRTRHCCYAIEKMIITNMIITEFDK